MHIIEVGWYYKKIKIGGLRFDSALTVRPPCIRRAELVSASPLFFYPDLALLRFRTKKPRF